MPTRALIFDFDGVIVETTRLKHQSYLEMVGEISPGFVSELDHALNTVLVGKERQHIVAWIREQIETDRSPEAMVDDFKRRVDQGWQTLEPREGIREFLDLAKSRSIRLGIVSAAPRAEIATFCQKNRLSFEQISGIEAGPKTGSLNLMIRDFGLSAQQVVYFGDMPTDLAAAKSVGTDFVRVESWAGKKCVWESQGLVTIRDFTDKTVAALID